MTRPGVRRPPVAAASASKYALHLQDVAKIYGRGESGVRALDGVTVGIPRGSFIAIMGPSGSGKSTFLHCASGLDRPTSGSVRIGETDLGDLDETQLTRLRRRRVGFVFQAFNLLPSLDVQQNVDLPLRLAGERPDRAWRKEILDRVGLGEVSRRRPAQLSGGQQQRVAIARALITRPDVVFGDELTGALDTMTAKQVLTLLRDCAEEAGQTVVMVTHDPLAASYASSVIYLADGRIVDEMFAPTADRIAERMTHLGAWA